MSVTMPPREDAVLARRDGIVAALRRIVPGEGVIATEREMRPYESDGLTAYRQLPLVVVLPSTTEQVSQVLRYCHDAGVKVVPRGAGTSLSGGALPLGDGVLRKAAERTVDGPWNAIGQLLDLFPPAECANYLANSGYASV